MYTNTTKCEKADDVILLSWNKMGEAESLNLTNFYLDDVSNNFTDKFMIK